MKSNNNAALPESKLSERRQFLLEKVLQYFYEDKLDEMHLLLSEPASQELLKDYYDFCTDLAERDGPLELVPIFQKYGTPLSHPNPLDSYFCTHIWRLDDGEREDICKTFLANGIYKAFDYQFTENHMLAMSGEYKENSNDGPPDIFGLTPNDYDNIFYRKQNLDTKVKTGLFAGASLGLVTLYFQQFTVEEMEQLDPNETFVNPAAENFGLSTVYVCLNLEYENTERNTYTIDKFNQKDKPIHLSLCPKHPDHPHLLQPLAHTMVNENLHLLFQRTYERNLSKGYLEVIPLGKIFKSGKNFLTTLVQRNLVKLASRILEVNKALGFQEEISLNDKLHYANCSLTLARKLADDDAFDLFKAILAYNPNQTVDLSGGPEDDSLLSILQRKKQWDILLDIIARNKRNSSRLDLLNYEKLENKIKEQKLKEEQIKGYVQLIQANSKNQSSEPKTVQTAGNKTKNSAVSEKTPHSTSTTTTTSTTPALTPTEIQKAREEVQHAKLILDEMIKVYQESPQDVKIRLDNVEAFLLADPKKIAALKNYPDFWIYLLTKVHCVDIVCLLYKHGVPLDHPDPFSSFFRYEICRASPEIREIICEYFIENKIHEASQYQFTTNHMLAMMGKYEETMNNDPPDIFGLTPHDYAAMFYPDKFTLDLNKKIQTGLFSDVSLGLVALYFEHLDAERIKQLDPNEVFHTPAARNFGLSAAYVCLNLEHNQSTSFSPAYFAEKMHALLVINQTKPISLNIMPLHPQHPMFREHMVYTMTKAGMAKLLEKLYLRNLELDHKERIPLGGNWNTNPNLCHLLLLKGKEKLIDKILTTNIELNYKEKISLNDKTSNDSSNTLAWLLANKKSFPLLRRLIDYDHSQVVNLLAGPADDELYRILFRENQFDILLKLITRMKQQPNYELPIALQEIERAVKERVATPAGIQCLEALTELLKLSDQLASRENKTKKPKAKPQPPNSKPTPPSLSKEEQLEDKLNDWLSPKQIKPNVPKKKENTKDKKISITFSSEDRTMLKELHTQLKSLTDKHQRSLALESLSKIDGKWQFSMGNASIEALSSFFENNAVKSTISGTNKGNDNNNNNDTSNGDKPSEPTEPLALTDEQQAQWKKEVLPHLFAKASVNFKWDAQKKCFVITLTDTLTVPASRKTESLLKGQAFTVSLTYIKAKILHRIKKHFDIHGIGSLEEGANNQIRIYPYLLAEHALPLVSQTFRDKIHRGYEKGGKVIPPAPPPPEEDPPSEQQQAPAVKTTTPNPIVVHSQADMPQTIKKLFQDITGQSFAFLNQPPNNMKPLGKGQRKGLRWEICYQYKWDGSPNIANVDAEIFLQTLQKTLDENGVNGLIVVHPKDKETGIIKIIVDVVQGDHKNNNNNNNNPIPFASVNDRLTKLQTAFQEKLKKLQPASTMATHNNDPVVCKPGKNEMEDESPAEPPKKAKPLQVVIDGKYLINLMYHLERLVKKIPAPQDKAHPRDLLHNLNFLVHCLRALDILKTGKVGDSEDSKIFDGWREIIRHAHKTKSWAEFYKLIHPVMAGLYNCFEKGMKLNDGTFKLFVSAVDLEPMRVALEPYMPALKTKSLTTETNPKKKRKLRQRYQKDIDAINADTSLVSKEEQELKVDAILGLHSLMGELGEPGVSNIIYIKFGHHDYDKVYRPWANNLYKENCSTPAPTPAPAPTPTPTP